MTYTKNTSTQRIQIHKEYKYTKNTNTQRIQTHKEYRYTKKEHRKDEKIRYTQRRNTGKMLRKKLFFFKVFFKQFLLTFFCYKKKFDLFKYKETWFNRNKK